MSRWENVTYDMRELRCRGNLNFFLGSNIVSEIPTLVGLCSGGVVRGPDVMLTSTSIVPAICQGHFVILRKENL